MAAGLSAADELVTDGATAEVLSLRTLRPLDVEGLATSVRRTGRLVLVEESPPRCSVSADIAALITEQEFATLRHPPLRVTAADTPVPFSPILEDAYLPDATRVAAAARATLAQ